ncbi:translation factor [Eremomyces bilateralis CBS 781.70]|uniref:Threonylcarbamoyl-AMP synthase n=1 Tax=Eremomyces bilateralis CBS 781.70 TaxID=1392243 RepID=A0A6G1FTK0_9PEZI|nr:translation factor [Eremomyces bilateralis CBS 781.70]KAF1809012.1 translation factor [Eremomyces bilateralis CBS 781.70]
MSNEASLRDGQSAYKTRVLRVDPSRAGCLKARPGRFSSQDDLQVEWHRDTVDYESLTTAVDLLHNTDVPVAFPTETVYGLGADATRTGAVQGIYTAKQRPSDNPLIVHVCSLKQLRRLLPPSNGGDDYEPIPKIYRALIQRFWPGPLTIILPTTDQSEWRLSPFTTAKLHTFGARMPSSPLALLLLKLCDLPLAAPSANASTRPSPTLAEHVFEDLNGRIQLILDGGPSNVGVESTVVDGLSDGGPVVLRPGGVSVAMLRECEGWENVRVAYKDKAEGDTEENDQAISRSMPRAPGMKYRHYSPRAKVVLFEPGATAPSIPDLKSADSSKGIGIIRTKAWDMDTILRSGSSEDVALWDVDIGPGMEDIARGLFAAFRELDQKQVDTILVEGIDSTDDTLAGAIMNRVRKAAELKIS